MCTQIWVKNNKIWQKMKMYKWFKNVNNDTKVQVLHDQERLKFEFVEVDILRDKWGDCLHKLTAASSYHCIVQNCMKCVIMITWNIDKVWLLKVHARMWLRVGWAIPITRLACLILWSVCCSSSFLTFTTPWYVDCAAKPHKYEIHIEMARSLLGTLTIFFSQ